MTHKTGTRSSGFCGARIIAHTSSFILGLALATAGAMAQSFPSKPIRFLVPFGPGGVGDIAVALAAIVLILWAPRQGIAGWRAYWAWNLAGLVDIALVVLTAARLALACRTEEPRVGER